MLRSKALLSWILAAGVAFGCSSEPDGDDDSGGGGESGSGDAGGSAGSGAGASGGTAGSAVTGGAGGQVSGGSGGATGGGAGSAGKGGSQSGGTSGRGAGGGSGGAQAGSGGASASGGSGASGRGGLGGGTVGGRGGNGGNGGNAGTSGGLAGSGAAGAGPIDTSACDPICAWELECTSASNCATDCRGRYISLTSCRDAADAFSECLGDGAPDCDVAQASCDSEQAAYALSCEDAPDGPDSCAFANDGACDEGGFCEPGTDSTDCRGS